MSATINEDATNAVANQPGEVGSHIPPTAPLQTTGHQPGKKVGNDAVPEANVTTFPPGTAPAANTFKPNNISEVPGQAPDNYAANQKEEGAATRASDTLGGASSADVHTGYGKPEVGQSSAEMHHDGHSHRKKERAGLQGVGAEDAPDGHATKASVARDMPGKDE